jgi:circadian clock protein KaiC
MAAKQRADPLFETGVPNLDFILGGGLPGSDVLLVIGPPGSGKTTLVVQMAFHAARRGHNVLYVSTYSEPPNRLLHHSRAFSFYDQSLIGKRVFLFSLYPLVKENLSSLRDALLDAVKQNDAQLVIVDGLMTLHDLYPDPFAVRAFLYELGATLSALECTTVLTRSLSELPRVDSSPELTTSDAVVELGMRFFATQTGRTIQVRKARGRSPRLGTHSLRIDGNGLTVFPRLESTDLPRREETPARRVPLGFAELDTMMWGGPHAGSATLVAGAVGTGKTVLSLQFLLEGARRGERGLLVGLRETPSELVAKAKRLGLDIEAAIRRKQIVLLHHAPVDLIADELGFRLVEAMDRLSPARMVIDEISDLEHAVRGERARGYLASLLRRLHNLGVTSLIVKEVAQVVGPELDFSDTPMALLAENLLFFCYVEFRGKLIRVLSILKMADSECDRSIRQYTITDKGLRVLPAVESAEGLLTGIARLGSERRIKRRRIATTTRRGRR